MSLVHNFDNSDQKRKRKFFILASSFGMLLVLAFSIIDYFEGDILSHCKKIRDDKGYWTQLEKYIGEHSNAEFSHGICPECAKELYPDLDLYSEGSK